MRQYFYRFISLVKFYNFTERIIKVKYIIEFKICIKNLCFYLFFSNAYFIGFQTAQKENKFDKCYMSN